MKSLSRLPRPQPRQATARPSPVRQEPGLEPGWGTAEQGTLGNAGVLDMLRANGAMGGVGPSSGGIQLKSVTPICFPTAMLERVKGIGRPYTRAFHRGL